MEGLGGLNTGLKSADSGDDPLQLAASLGGLQQQSATFQPASCSAPAGTAGACTATCNAGHGIAAAQQAEIQRRIEAEATARAAALVGNEKEKQKQKSAQDTNATKQDEHYHRRWEIPHATTGFLFFKGPAVPQGRATDKQGARMLISNRPVAWIIALMNHPRAQVGACIAWSVKEVSKPARTRNSTPHTTILAQLYCYPSNQYTLTSTLTINLSFSLVLALSPSLDTVVLLPSTQSSSHAFESSQSRAAAYQS